MTATFYNFSPSLVAHMIPRAWTLASPEQVLAARLDAARASLTRMLGAEAAGSAEVAELAGLLREACERPHAGRPAAVRRARRPALARGAAPRAVARRHPAARVPRRRPRRRAAARRADRARGADHAHGDRSRLHRAGRPRDPRLAGRGVGRRLRGTGRPRAWSTRTGSPTTARTCGRTSRRRPTRCRPTRGYCSAPSGPRGSSSSARASPAGSSAAGAFGSRDLRRQLNRLGGSPGRATALDSP